MRDGLGVGGGAIVSSYKMLRLGFQNQEQNGISTVAKRSHDSNHNKWHVPPRSHPKFNQLAQSTALTKVLFTAFPMPQTPLLLELALISQWFSNYCVLFYSRFSRPVYSFSLEVNWLIPAEMASLICLCLRFAYIAAFYSLSDGVKLPGASSKSTTTSSSLFLNVWLATYLL